jgi:integrase
MRGYVRKYRNSWAGVVEMGNDPGTGKRLQKWVYASTEEECQQKLNKLVYELQEGIYTEPSKMTVEQYLRQWIEMHASNITQSTIDCYKVVIEKHVVPEIGKVLLTQLTPMHLQKLYAEELKKYSGRTAQLTHRVLRKALQNAYRMQIIRQNPADLVDAPKAKKYKLDNKYDAQDFENLMDAAVGTIHEIPILLAGGLGMRRGEIFGLRWKDVNFRKNLITIEQQLIPNSAGLTFQEPKTEGSARTLDTPEYIMGLLKNHLKEQEKSKGFFQSEYADYNLVCCKPNGELINPAVYSRQFGQFLKKMNLPHIRFHDLRHFNATIMLKSDIPVKVASERLGHSNTAITQDTYQYVLDEMDQEASKKISEALFADKKDKTKKTKTRK